MAPDINSLPPSPYSPRRITSTSSRRAADTMAPPPAPISPLPQSPTIMSREPLANASSGDNTGVGIGPGMRANTSYTLTDSLWLTPSFAGPLRHPRPLTAADLHMQLEKEQEAVVRRRRTNGGIRSLIRVVTRSTASLESSPSSANNLPR